MTRTHSKRIITHMEDHTMATTTMHVFLIEVRDSDGNDCSVFDAIVTAPSRDAASEKLWKYLSEAYPNDERDGGFGTFRACDCECGHAIMRDESMICPQCSDEWECSHGGLLTNEDGDVETYATVAEAMAARATYHSLIDLTDDEEVTT